MVRFARLAALLGIVTVLSGCVVVEDGTVGISMSFGSIRDELLPPGIYANVPLFREVDVWNVHTQRRTIPIEIPSAEGLIVGLQTAVLYRPTRVVELRKMVGKDFVNIVMLPEMVDAFRETIGKERVEDLIVAKEKVAIATKTILGEAMEKRGIFIEEILIIHLDLPSKFKVAIEQKLESEQKALQKQFELQQAEKDAEIEVARAKGAAQAQEIVRRTLSPEYLQYLWISTLNQNPNVIYVATEANMPLFRTARR